MRRYMTNTLRAYQKYKVNESALVTQNSIRRHLIRIELVPLVLQLAAVVRASVIGWRFVRPVHSGGLNGGGRGARLRAQKLGETAEGTKAAEGV